VSAIECLAGLHQEPKIADAVSKFDGSNLFLNELRRWRDANGCAKQNRDWCIGVFLAAEVCPISEEHVTEEFWEF
jgi:hypothetical protein